MFFLYSNIQSPCDSLTVPHICEPASPCLGKQVLAFLGIKVTHFCNEILNPIGSSGVYSKTMNSGRQGVKGRSSRKTDDIFTERKDDILLCCKQIFNHFSAS